MSETSPAFEFVCERLETIAKISRIEARGTVRLALREVGKNPAYVSPQDMATIVTRVLPRMLQTRGVRDSAQICQEIATQLSQAKLASGATYLDPAEVFARLGSDRKKSTF
ncbi:MAG TPA: hypothetical protein PKA58_01175 [Polyangium sp.]|nr:hypothetical protein [Polyangium sp.]